LLFAEVGGCCEDEAGFLGGVVERGSGDHITRRRVVQEVMGLRRRVRLAFPDVVDAGEPSLPGVNGRIGTELTRHQVGSEARDCPIARSVYHGIQTAQRATTTTIVPSTMPFNPMSKNFTKT